MRFEAYLITPYSNNVSAAFAWIGFIKQNVGQKLIPACVIFVNGIVPQELAIIPSSDIIIVMTIELAKRTTLIKPSPTLTLAAKARELKAQGEDIIDLSVGEPDFATPENIKDAAIKAIKNNFTKYTAVDGIPNLKQAIIDKLWRENKLKYEPKQILVSCGAKHSLYNLMQAIISAGDEVIIPAPYWTSYPDIVLLADGKPVIIKTGLEQNFKITPQQLETVITPATKAIIINSPSNPTGVAYTQHELTQLADILLKHPKIVIISDDIYEHIMWNATPFHNVINVCPELYERTIVINGVSKAYSMTGWRIGYAAGAANVVAAMKNIQSQSTSNPTSISQIAAEEALRGKQDYISEATKAFKERHDFVVAGLNEISGFKVMPSDGTFYSFPNVEATIKKARCKDDVEFSEMLLKRAKVALVPGSAFGAPGYIRMSFATGMEELEKALQRCKAVIR